MIKKFWCWLWGHKNWQWRITPSTPKGYKTQVWNDNCPRCGEELKNNS